MKKSERDICHQLYGVDNDDDDDAVAKVRPKKKYLSELKIGDKIKTYCFGDIVEGTVIQTDGIGVCVRHKPVRWGNDICIETWVQPSTYLQKKWGGKNLTPGAETTPAAWYKDKAIKCRATG